VDDIREKIESLVRLAKRPGTVAEGIVARESAIRLSLKYGIPCEFTSGPAQDSKPPSSKPPSSSPPPKPKQKSPEELFSEWIRALESYGWTVTKRLDTKIGLQVCFRHSELKSEIRVTQREADPRQFEAEHIMRPDPVKGYDMSYMSYFTIHLPDLLRHVAYAKKPWYEI
jgi:hypothetical protein